MEAVSTKDVLGFPKRETVAFLDSLMFLNTAAVETARSLELDTLATSCHCWYWRFLFTLLSGFECEMSPAGVTWPPAGDTVLGGDRHLGQWDLDGISRWLGVQLRRS